MSRFLSRRFEFLEPYTPGEQPQTTKFIKLNTNESPYPPSPKGVAKISADELDKLRLYSDPEAKELVSEIAKFYGLSVDNVVVGNGSDEILAFVFMAFCDSEKEICFPDITYGFYSVYAKLFGLKVNKVALRSDFSINTDDYLGVGKNIILANPNAQTGIYLQIGEIEKILQNNCDHLVIIDEAYVDFGGESCRQLLDKYSNLIVVQTFSKSRQLAGGRIGFALASKEICDDLRKIKFSFNPYNINRLSLKLGAEAMKDKQYFDECRGKIIVTREWTKAKLQEMNFEVLPSKANFLLARTAKISGKEVYLELKKRGVLVRHFDDERICDYVRITIGLEEEMEILINNLKEMLAQKA